jgi:transposase-like protein
MGMKRQFSRDFKLSVLKELETKRLAEVCRIHDLAPSTVIGWRRDYEANPKEAFKGHGRIWKEEAILAEKDRLIGKLYAEIVFLKKAYERLKLLQIEEKRKERSLLR